MPESERIADLAGVVLPVLRHLNDLPAIAAALATRPDWVIPTNTAHWNAAVAARTWLRSVTPARFLHHFELRAEAGS